MNYWVSKADFRLAREHERVGAESRMVETESNESAGTERLDLDRSGAVWGVVTRVNNLRDRKWINKTGSQIATPNSQRQIRGG